MNCLTCHQDIIVELPYLRFLSQFSGGFSTRAGITSETMWNAMYSAHLRRQIWT
jgi:hypothetical protein